MLVFGDFFGDGLVALVKNGSVPEFRLDDMVIRTLTPLLQLQNSTTYPQPSFDVRDLTKPTNNVRRDHHKIIRQIAQDAITLVKNNRTAAGGLPLKAPESLQSIAIIGEDAGSNPFGATSCGQSSSACKMNANNGTLTAGGGSGYVLRLLILFLQLI